MGDLTTLHGQAKKLVLCIREGLEKLEAVEAGIKHGDAPELSRELCNKLAELQRISQELETVWRMFVMREPPARRAVWKGKVEQVVEEADAIRRALEKYSTRERRRAAETAEREELFQRADAGRRAKAEMDTEGQMATSVARSKRVLEEMFETGNNILANMAGSRERLKAAQRKAMDMLHSIGLGDTLLKLIERRQRMDILLTYGGMVVVLLIVLLVIWIVWR